MKFSLVILITFLLTAPGVKASQQSKILSYCSNYGDGVSFSFSSCANANFSRAGRSFGRVFSYCFNSGQDVSFSFTSCINSNFRSIERAANGNLYLRYCSNFNRDRLDFSYVSCVNSNFSQISRFITP